MAFGQRERAVHELHVERALMRHGNEPPGQLFTEESAQLILAATGVDHRDRPRNCSSTKARFENSQVASLMVLKS